MRLSGADSPQERGTVWPAPQVAEALDVALGTVYRIKQRFAEDRLDSGLKWLWLNRAISRAKNVTGIGWKFTMTEERKPKPKPRWDVHLLSVGSRAGSLAGMFRPLTALDSPAAPFHFVFPGSQTGQEFADPLLHRLLASQAQIASAPPLSPSPRLHSSALKSVAVARQCSPA